MTDAVSDAAAERSAPRLLIAEDEAIIRLDLKEMLEEEGYAVVGEAADGEAALRLATGTVSRSRHHGREDAGDGRPHGGGARSWTSSLGPS